MGKVLDPWKTLARRELFRLEPRIAVFLESVQLPNGRIVDDYCQVEMPTYAIILAETSDNQFICERQYKHGIRKITRTLPAGQVESGEDPLAAAQRELLEETGYQCPQWRRLQVFRSHANQGGATIHFFVGHEAIKTQDSRSDDLEDTDIELMTRKQILEALRAGEFCVMADATIIALALLQDCPAKQLR